MPTRLPLLICLISGIVMFGQYFLSHPAAKAIYENALEWWQIIFAFTLFVGVAGFIKVSLKSMRQKKERPYRLISLTGLFLMPLLALLGGTKIDSPFLWIFENMQAPMQATVFSLLAFFVASASFRGFRARSIPATILLVTAVIILIGRIPIAEHISDFLPKLAFWIQDNPSMSARRAILIGIGLGSMTTSLRVILGIERTYLRGD
jgi:FlaA1/EpsC-like NDP-sugar epimerase